MSGLLIANGLVVDGTGAPGRTADVRICDGRIVEVGEGLERSGEVVLQSGKATGALPARWLVRAA
ncbi:MAG: hypothetical protein AB7F98_04075 [Novosphingobium sp.]